MTTAHDPQDNLPADSPAPGAGATTVAAHELVDPDYLSAADRRWNWLFRPLPRGHLAMQILTLVLLTVVTLSAAATGTRTITTGVPDRDLYHWWDGVCTNHQLVYATSRDIAGASDITTLRHALFLQSKLFHDSAQRIAALPFPDATIAQKRGREMVIAAFANSEDKVKNTALSTVLADPSDHGLQLGAYQLSVAYEDYTQQLSAGLDKVGAGTPANVRQIRALPQCRAFI